MLNVPVGFLKQGFQLVVSEKHKLNIVLNKKVINNTGTTFSGLL